MKCSRCLSDVEILTTHEQFLWDASHLCAECRDKVFEESYKVQNEISCCRNCRNNDWVEDFGILCSINKKPVSTVGLCSRFEVA